MRLHAADDERHVLPAETEGIRHRHVETLRARLVRHVIQIAVRIPRLEVDRGRQHLVAERERVDVLGGDVRLPHLGLPADLRGQLTDTLETIVHTAAATADAPGGSSAADPSGTANALLLAERCFMSGRLQRFVHVSGATEDRMVRAAMNAGLPVTIIGPGINTMDSVVNAVVRAVEDAARCA